jgi:hypothetical protein
VALAPLAWTIAFVRAGRAVHTKGVGYEAELVLDGAAATLAAGTVLAEVTTVRVPARLSRGYGRPFDKPDVHGLAIRIADADGAGDAQDLLMSSSKRGRGRDATAISVGYGPVLSSTLSLGAPSGAIVVRATAVEPMPDDAVVHAGAAGGAAFDLEVARPGEDGERVGRLTLGAPLPPEEAEALAFTLRHDAGAIHLHGTLNAARAVVYRASQAGRARRTRWRRR